ncbi:hypothetical protein AAHB33_02680 [Paenarthrobacter sp. S56]|uniref:hypothetical protein n=1 Tax=Paenarthrobacter sp. S56 TaxID=3138179 RepID=UPI00321BFA7A
MTDVPGDDAPGVGEGTEKDKGTPGLLGDAMSPVIAPEDTDEERLGEPEANGQNN